MFNSLRCKLKGHVFVDSRSMPGMQTCVRCRVRRPFESVRDFPPATTDDNPPRA
jgi:hypothetical protein